ncbi:MAG: CPBP family intramembrane metalloprotease [Clostridiales bacterium]|jgi:membrane protease YdiL (CAAX protease family)|nr:CPBP family intramembrane metalloprotease [Clostridiales bacterium]
MRELELYAGAVKDRDPRQRNYRLTGVMLFCSACALLAVRTGLNLLYSAVPMSDITVDVIFTLVLQILFLLVMPVLFYVFAFKKKSAKEVLQFSNFRKTRWYNYVLAAALGVFALFVTMGISTLWQIIISLFGYTHSQSDETYPAAFFILSIFLTGILPGFCEEFTMRGGFLTTLRDSFGLGNTLVIAGVAFGLFHQNITQVCYTALFGAFMAFVVVKTGSIFPAMIIHFMNNSVSVYLDYASTYGWWGGGFYERLDVQIQTSFGAVFGIYLAVCACFAGLAVLLWHLNSHEKLRKKKEFIQDAGFDVTHGRVVPVGNENPALVSELELDNEVYGRKLVKNLFKPALADNVFYIGAAAVAGASTLFSFIWGWII